MTRALRDRRRTAAPQRAGAAARFDPIALEVFNHRLSAIAEEMGAALCRCARRSSTNRWRPEMW